MVRKLPVTASLVAMSIVGANDVRFVFCDLCEWKDFGPWSPHESAALMAEHKKNMHVGETA